MLDDLVLHIHLLWSKPNIRHGRLGRKSNTIICNFNIWNACGRSWRDRTNFSLHLSLETIEHRYDCCHLVHAKKMENQSWGGLKSEKWPLNKRNRSWSIFWNEWPGNFRQFFCWITGRWFFNKTSSFWYCFFKFLRHILIFNIEGVKHRTSAPIEWHLRCLLWLSSF